MLRNGRNIVAVILLVASGVIAEAQTFKFDVKTKFSEKAQLKVIKFGVMNAIEAAEWAENTETGEDYSLWLKDMVRTKAGDSLKLSLLVELRKPAMIREGDLISSRTMEVAISAIELDSLSSDESANEAVARYLEQHKLLTRLTTLVMSSIQPGTSPYLVILANYMLKEFNREPSAQEIYESTIVGAEVLVAVDEMLSE